MTGVEPDEVVPAGGEVSPDAEAASAELVEVSSLDAGVVSVGVVEVSPLGAGLVSVGVVELSPPGVELVSAGVAGVVVLVLPILSCRHFSPAGHTSENCRRPFSRQT
jgi:hypothetical protein